MMAKGRMALASLGLLDLGWVRRSGWDLCIPQVQRTFSRSNRNVQDLVKVSNIKRKL